MKRILFASLMLAFLSGPVSAKQGDWNRYDSRYFVIYYRNAPLDFVKNVAETAEELYSEIARSLGFMRYRSWGAEERGVIYIHDDKEAYKKHAQNLEWSGGMAIISRKEIVTYAAASGFFDSTLPHELGHIIFREFIGYNPVPVWLDEGVAMYQEKAKRWGANKTVLAAMEQGKFLPLTELTAKRLQAEKSEEIINIFYAESASIVYYMIVELGEYRFENFCRRLSDGVPFEEALKKSYGRFNDIKQLNDAWVDFLKSQK